MIPGSLCKSATSVFNTAIRQHFVSAKVQDSVETFGISH